MIYSTILAMTILTQFPGDYSAATIQVIPPPLVQVYVDPGYQVYPYPYQVYPYYYQPYFYFGGYYSPHYYTSPAYRPAPVTPRPTPHPNYYHGGGRHR